MYNFLIWFSEFYIILVPFAERLKPISDWLIGINFTFSIFSINFTFFGYQFSRYKPILGKLDVSQWARILLLLALPFIPLLSFIVIPELHALIALIFLPIIVVVAIYNTLITAHNLDPIIYLSKAFAAKSLKKYCDRLYDHISPEVRAHEEYTANKDKFQIPTHEWFFSPSSLGLREQDLWDKVIIITKQAFSNNDYPVFIKTIDYIMELLTYSYRISSKQSDDYRQLSGISAIAHRRLRGLINWISENDKEGIYLETIANVLCTHLKKTEIIQNPFGDLANNLISDMTYIGSIMLNSKKFDEPKKILNTIHAIIELAIHQIEDDEKNGKERSLERYNIAVYAHLIKSLGYDAIKTGQYDFVYRCMETLSYLGCNAAKIKSEQTIITTFECLVQLGRISRKKGLFCSWDRCLVPLHSHAEQFIGYILTWLGSDNNEKGSFFLKEYAENAYSRLRGVRCKIKYKDKPKPVFQLEEILDQKTNMPIPHIETMTNEFGYNGRIDYSDFDTLKEYRLNPGSDFIRILSP